jgi:hypothetical protein
MNIGYLGPEGTFAGINVTSFSFLTHAEESKEALCRR